MCLNNNPPAWFRGRFMALEVFFFFLNKACFKANRLGMFSLFPSLAKLLCSQAGFGELETAGKMQRCFI